MQTEPISHSFFKQLPKNWHGRVPVKVSLKQSVHHFPDDGAPIVARAGIPLRTVIGRDGEIQVITKRGRLVPVDADNVYVLQFLEITPE
jgi:hypothetical protein